MIRPSPEELLGRRPDSRITSTGRWTRSSISSTPTGVGSWLRPTRSQVRAPKAVTRGQRVRQGPGRATGPVARLLRMAARHAARSARRGRLAESVIEARRPKLLAASTRLAPAPPDAGGRARSRGPPRPRTPRLRGPVVAAPSAPGPQAPKPALQEMYGMSDAAYEWVFGSPQKALARSDVVAGGMPNLPPPRLERRHRAHPAQRGRASPRPSAPRRRRRPTAPPLGRKVIRGAQILEGPARREPERGSRLWRPRRRLRRKGGAGGCPARPRRARATAGPSAPSPAPTAAQPAPTAPAPTPDAASGPREPLCSLRRRVPGSCRWVATLLAPRRARLLPHRHRRLLPPGRRTRPRPPAGYNTGAVFRAGARSEPAAELAVTEAAGGPRADARRGCAGAPRAGDPSCLGDASHAGDYSRRGGAPAPASAPAPATAGAEPPAPAVPPAPQARPCAKRGPSPGVAAGPVEPRVRPPGPRAPALPWLGARLRRPRRRVRCRPPLPERAPRRSAGGRVLDAVRRRLSRRESPPRTPGEPAPAPHHLLRPRLRRRP